MQVYLVGGAVRDRLLGLPVQERDFVVVGATPEEMLKLGYNPVGKDFPVFLHPKTHEEYALARTERKTAKGYKGFQFYADPDVTLEDDLKRRDLTINAMAEAADGKIIDPYGGQKDLAKKILHHVSDAFVEDPVRILRVARFAARFGDFTIYPETMLLMRQMTENGEVDALVAERVWQELQCALAMQFPWRFFETLFDCHALAILFPEFMDNFPHAMTVLKKATVVTNKASLRFAALLSILSAQEIKNFCARIKAPTQYGDLALLAAKYQNDFCRALNLAAEEILVLLEHVDAFRRPERFADFLLVEKTLAPEDSNLQQERLTKAFVVAKQVALQPLLAMGLQGKEINDGLHKLRKDAISSLLISN